MKLYARAAQALIMLGVGHVYGELARRFGRMKLLALVFLFWSRHGRRAVRRDHAALMVLLGTLDADERTTLPDTRTARDFLASSL